MTEPTDKPAAATERQFVAVTFNPTHARTYTYHNDGPPVAAGDRVKVPDHSGEGWKAVTVVEAFSAKPPFATKPILGLIIPQAAPVRSLLDGMDDQ